MKTLTLNQSINEFQVIVGESSFNTTVKWELDFLITVKVFASEDEPSYLSAG